MKGQSQTAQLFTSKSTKPTALGKSWSRTPEAGHLVTVCPHASLRALVCCSPHSHASCSRQRPPIAALAASTSALLFPVTPRTSLMLPPQHDKQNRQCSPLLLKSESYPQSPKNSKLFPLSSQPQDGGCVLQLPYVTSASNIYLLIVPVKSQFFKFLSKTSPQKVIYIVTIDI